MTNRILKPCPFCGKKPTEITSPPDYVFCKRCQSHARLFKIKVWQSRTSHDMKLKKATKLIDRISKSMEAWAEDDKQDASDAFSLLCTFREWIIDYRTILTPESL